jgi:hypothetical protein
MLMCDGLEEEIAELASVEQMFVDGAAQVAIGRSVRFGVSGSTGAFAIESVIVDSRSNPGLHGCKGR